MIVNIPLIRLNVQKKWTSPLRESKIPQTVLFASRTQRSNIYDTTRSCAWCTYLDCYFHTLHINIAHDCPQVSLKIVEDLVSTTVVHHCCVLFQTPLWLCWPKFFFSYLVLSSTILRTLSSNYSLGAVSVPFCMTVNSIYSLVSSHVHVFSVWILLSYFLTSFAQVVDVSFALTTHRWLNIERTTQQKRCSGSL